MQPITVGVDPYSLPSIGAVQSNDSFASWLFQPIQQNSSGTLPGTTVINVGQNMSINGHTGTIAVGAGSPVLLDGTNQRILITNATTGIPQIIIGLLPDGNYGMVISKPGIDVTTVFN